MKPVLLSCCIFLNFFLQAQGKVNSINPKDTNAARSLKPEILNNGFIDVINNGQVNASARLIRIIIGEPGKFAIPLSIYSGVSANNFQNYQTPVATITNDVLVSGFINPLSGLINISGENVMYFKKPSTLTRSGWIYHTGLRMLTGYRTGAVTDPQRGKPINFLNKFAATGFYYQTGAWEKNNAKNMGIFWASFRYIGSHTSPRQIREFLPWVFTNGFYHGYSIGSGIEINNFVNIKIIYYKYIKRPEIGYALPIYQFSFNYNLK